MSKLNISLIDNSKSFLCEALHKAIQAEANPQEWKFAIFNLVQSIELGLKELVRKQHPILIYKNIDEPVHTISLEVAVKRLKNIAGISFLEADLKTIKAASNIRNQIVHYEIIIDIKEFKLLFAKLFGFIQDFYLNKLDTTLDSFIPTVLWQNGIRIHEYGSELYSRALAIFKEKDYTEEYIYTCPHCGWDALCAWDDIDTCYVCGHQEHLERCASCDKVIGVDDSEEYNKSHYCKQCYEYITDDYWYEISN